MTKKRFVNKGKDIFQYGEWWCSAGGEHCADVIATAINELIEENEELKQSIKEIDDAELHLKQIILKRIDDYIWEWEDEGTPVAQVLRELRDEIKGDVE